ncbi:co-chaperone GroES [Phycisphaeraceae bacterium D3-23]
MNIKPLGDKILVKRVEAETKTASGLYLPESAKEKPQEAKVIAVGTGKILDNGERAPFTVKKGDTVILNKWGGTEIKHEGDDLIMLSEDEVLAVVS